MMIRILSQDETREGITMRQAIEVMRDLFRQLSSGQVDMPLAHPYQPDRAIY
jgi:ornithine cyclodeaminase/alanine dehydrogenase-like protein (mu-crystallin family)